MNELKIFENPEFGSVRNVEVEGNLYFVASDIAKALGYAKPQNAIAMHCKGALKQGIGVQTGVKADGTPAIQTIDMLIIPEGDIYRLIIHSKLPSAEKFEQWVFDEVIPSIRQTGSYQKKLSPVDMMRIQLGMIDNHEDRITNLENNMTLDYGQQKALEDVVNRTVIEALGGKGSCAYDGIGRKVFAECNRDLKNYFNVNARNNIPKKRFDEAIQYAKRWKPCTNTVMKICDYNAQQKFQL